MNEQTGLYEIPQVSEEMGAIACVKGFREVTRFAQAVGADWIREVSDGFDPLPTGRSWRLIAGHWIEVGERE